MPEALGVLLLALAPPGANFVGGLLAEVLPISKKALNRALHAAAGIVIAVVAVEIMPMSLEALPAWALALAFLTGGVLYVWSTWRSERGATRTRARRACG